jgi:hypothetical protein
MMKLLPFSDSRRPPGRVAFVKQRSVARGVSAAVVVKLHFVEPVPGGQVADRKRHHWLDEIDWGFVFHPN